MASTISTFILLSLSSFLSLPNPATAEYPKPATGYSISAVFAFGDSTVDSGNNNKLPGIHAKHLPYGRDLSPYHRPTGRFSNGFLVTDYISDLLTLKPLLPAYLDPSTTDHDLLTGASFGSSGSGLDNRTNYYNHALSMEKQFALFEEAVARIKKQVGVQNATDIISNALYVVSTGTNDMLYNVYLQHKRDVQYSLPTYQDLLLDTFDIFLTKLYKVGGRKFFIASLPPIGCLPLLVTANSMFPGDDFLKRECNEKQNQDSQDYNLKLLAHVQAIEVGAMAGSNIALWDAYTPMLDQIKNPKDYSYHKTLEACCGTGYVEMSDSCNMGVSVCTDPIHYVFWDSLHPTQAVYRVLFLDALSTALSYVIN